MKKTKDNLQIGLQWYESIIPKQQKQHYKERNQQRRLSIHPFLNQRVLTHWPIGQCAWTPLEWKNTVTWSWQNKTETSMGMPWKNKPKRSHLLGHSPLLTYHLPLRIISVMLHLDSWIITYAFNEDRQLGSQLHKQQLWSEGPETLVDWPRGNQIQLRWQVRTFLYRHLGPLCLTQGVVKVEYDVTFFTSQCMGKKLEWGSKLMMWHHWPFTPPQASFYHTKAW